jgi:prepilin-type processing-associated H-X9-DG protein
MMRQLAFTVVEVLVVIVIIALIVGMLLPTLQSSKSRSKAIVCSSHVRQLVLGLTAYETEQGTFPYSLNDTKRNPPLGGYPGHSGFDRIGWWWFNFIADRPKQNSYRDDILWCPARYITNSSLRSDVLCGNYGVNLSVCKISSGLGSQAEFIGTPLATVDLPHSSETLLVVDSGYSMISWWHATDTPPMALGKTIEDTAYIPGLHINKDKNLWPGQELDAIEGRHPDRRVNVGFVDGHITCVQAEQLLVEKTEDAYKNLRPLWVPK